VERALLFPRKKYLIELCDEERERKKGGNFRRGERGLCIEKKKKRIALSDRTSATAKVQSKGKRGSSFQRKTGRGDRICCFRGGKKRWKEAPFDRETIAATGPFESKKGDRKAKCAGEKSLRIGERPSPLQKNLPPAPKLGKGGRSGCREKERKRKGGISRSVRVCAN